MARKLNLFVASLYLNNIKNLFEKLGVTNRGQEPCNCYTSLVYWAFHGGAISHKWLRNYTVASQAEGGVERAGG